MDPKPDAPMALAPGRSSGAENSWPPVDEYLDPPEVTRYERVDGRGRQIAPLATPEHGDPHFRLHQLLGLHLAEGYVGSVDLKTRVAEDVELASDTCVRREGIDPETGRRHLEELVFEVVYKRSLEETARRAQAFADRGVRRQIAIFVKSSEVKEWSKAKQGWRPLDLRRSLQDPCLARPLPLRALFDNAEAEEAMALALEAKGAFARMKKESEARGRAKALLAFLEGRGFTLPEDVRSRALMTTDRGTLERWLRAAVTASSLDEVFGDESG